MVRGEVVILVLAGSIPVGHPIEVRQCGMRPRSCFRADGRSKIGHIEQHARERAVTQTLETGEMFDAYECWACGKWHTGRRKIKLGTFDACVFGELGPRAYGHWKQGDTRMTIFGRFVSAGRVLLRSWKV